MSTNLPQLFKEKRNGVLLTAAVALVLVGYGGYRYYTLSETLAVVRSEFASSTSAFESRVKMLEVNLASSTDQNEQLTSALRAEQGKNEYFDLKIKNILDTVGTLDTLSKLDSRLLQKYSRVYFLNENYTPATLANINTEFLSRADKPLQMHTAVLPYLQKLMASAAESGAALKVLSAYRSFGEQSSLKSSYKITYGSGANQFSADQGYSEHQLGTTIDFTTSSLASYLEGFKDTAEYKWLTENAYKFGFILSYPEHNAYYQFEPWHWRFVGVSLATRIHDEGKYFYDMDQRLIDQYLILIFK